MTFTHFYSDPHFGHKSIIGMCGRPFEDVGHMNESLIHRYNMDVKADDFVLWCGDGFFTSFDKSKAILDRMNGRKALVIGNHDRSAGRMVDMGFEFVVDTMTLRMMERTVLVSHYPYFNEGEEVRFPHLRPKRIKGQALIHGHTHSSKERIGTAIHVGVDAWGYRPAPRKRVEALVWEAFS